jgi:hypothetical protein
MPPEYDQGFPQGPTACFPPCSIFGWSPPCMCGHATTAAAINDAASAVGSATRNRFAALVGATCRACTGFEGPALSGIGLTERANFRSASSSSGLKSGRLSIISSPALGQNLGLRREPSSPEAAKPSQYRPAVTLLGHFLSCPVVDRAKLDRPRRTRARVKVNHSGSSLLGCSHQFSGSRWAR